MALIGLHCSKKAMKHTPFVTARNAIRAYMDLLRRSLCGILVTKMQILILVKAVIGIRKSSERSVHFKTSKSCGRI